jgi:hypothetical protein
MQLIIMIYSIFSLNIYSLGNRNHSNFNKTTEIIPGKLTVVLPSNLKKLSSEEIILESPLVNQRPSSIYEDKTRKIKFAINYGSSPALDTDLPQIKVYFEKVYKGVAKQFISSDLKVINHQKFIVMRFNLSGKYPTTGLVSNYLFITVLKGKLLMADYSFLANERFVQEQQAAAILSSFKIIG